MRTRVIAPAALAAICVPFVGSVASADSPDEPPTMVARGAYDSGVGEAGSEIVAVDGRRNLMLVTNGALDRIDIVDIRDVDRPALVRAVDLTPFGASVQSVAVGGNVYAAAVSGASATDDGTVVVFDRKGRVRATYRVGNLPDSLTFDPSGRYIVVANEGEPICWDADGDADGNDDEDELLVDPEGSVSIIDLRKRQVRTADFRAWDGQEDALRSQGIRIFFPGSSTSQDLEPEYVTVSGGTAYVTLQEANAVAVVDLRSATVTDLLPLGYQDHSQPGKGFDPSNRDGGELIANYDVLGMYMPDTIASTRIDGETYLVTANEGDSRDYPCYSEEIRVKDADLGDAYDDALEADEFLGRLKTTTAFPTTFDAAGQIEQVYSYGARSFSIWTTGGTQVYDSGDQFEQQLLGTPFFNLDGTETDERSDDKGPEPEALAVGEIDGATYAFIGLERSGGIMMYDISDPADARFVQYLNTLDLGDTAPEGIVFVPAGQSPTRTPLLAVSFEVSGTTRLIELDVHDDDDDDDDDEHDDDDD